MRENLNQSYIRLSHGDSIYSKPKRLVVKLHFYILYSARLAIPISKINFEISTFSNFLRDVQLKWFHFKHRSHTIESVLMTIFSDEPNKTILKFFSCLKVSNILTMQNLQNISRLDKNLHIFYLLSGLICYWDQMSTFSLLLAHLVACSLSLM